MRDLLLGNEAFQRTYVARVTTPRTVGVLLALAACRGATGGRESQDTAARADTAAHATTDTADTSLRDTGDTSPPDTSPPAPVPTGRVDVRAWRAGVTHVWACVDSDLSGGWVDALGNVAGSVTCAAEDGHSLALTFTRGGAGSWSDPSGGVDFVWTLPDGARVQHAAGELAPTRWSVAFTRWERVTLDTIALDATLAGTWTPASGGEDVARVDATLSVLLPG